MAQDLREMFEKERAKKYSLREGHEQRFLQRLEKELPAPKKSSFYVLKIAASIAILFSVGIFGYKQFSPDKKVETTVVNAQETPVKSSQISLGDLSPDLKKVENYYVANINLELAQLEISPDNKALVDGYMERLAELNREYERLNNELNTMGPNDQMINALIKNLQLRLQLLQKLKNKLNELKLSKNEQVTSNIV